MEFFFEVCAITHTGLVRSNNEDRIAVNSWGCSSNDDQALEFKFPFSEPLICLVADGMGGHAAGEIASRITADHLSSKIRPTGNLNEIAEIIEETNQEIFTSMQEDSYGMGSTVAGVRFEQESAVIFNVGDSRVYIYENSLIKQISVDDTLVSGTGISKKHSSAITQSLGGGAKRQRINPHIFDADIKQGQKFLICSDGLSDLVEDQEIEEILKMHTANDVTHLLNCALDRGGRDNISIISVAVR